VGRTAIGLIALALVGAGAVTVFQRGTPERATPALAVAQGLRGGPDGFARALHPRRFSFPDDHGPHPEYRTEWWYFTGNLDATGGRHFGYELTLFRFGLSRKPVPRASHWATNQVYMAHFAVTDVADGAFHAFERLTRGALGLAGAQAAPLRVWVEDWSVQGSGEQTFPLHLKAAEHGVAIDLALTTAKVPVLQGDAGFSRKSAEPGNASYYYSMTRIPTHGSLQVGGATFQVSGLSWMDREWGTSALAADQVGWDWFALQLSDGRELMFYRLRRRDGSADPFSAGTLVAEDGSTAKLASAHVRIEVLDRWRSPSGTRYPSHWRLSVPEKALDLDIVPYLADQELDLSVRYWEGAVKVRGIAAGKPVQGEGYVELTGYGEAPLSLDGASGGSSWPRPVGLSR
jgi:predicted secreted hydrolase